MKKTLVFTALLACSLAVRAESLRVHFPADFPAAGTLVPAGDYSISPVTGSPAVLRLEGSGLHAFVFGRIVQSDAKKTTVELETSLKRSKLEGTTAGAVKLGSLTK